MNSRLECPAGGHGIADDDRRGLACGGALRIAVQRIRVYSDERVGGDEVEPLLFDAGLATLLQHRIEVGGGIDAFLHERPHEVGPAGVLAKVVEEHVREAVVGPRGVEIRPVVQLRVGRTQVHVAVRRREAVVAFAEHGLALVEPDRGTPARIELDHVTELVGDDPVELARAGARAERVDVDHLALRRELVHPGRLLIRAAEVSGRGAGKPREHEVDARVGVDPRRPLLPVETAVGRVHLVLEARARGAQAVQVDARVVRDPPLRVIGHETKRRGGLDVLLRGEVVRPEILDAADVLDRRRRANGLEAVRRQAGTSPHRSRELETVRVRQGLREQRRCHVQRAQG